MLIEKEMFFKDEEKDINLLLSRIKQNPQNFKDRVQDKVQEFGVQFELIKQNPSEKNQQFYSLCMFVGQLYEFFPKQMESLVEGLIKLFEIYKNQLNPFTRMKIIQTLLLIQKKGYLSFIATFDFFIRIFELKDKKLRQLIFYSMISNIEVLMKTKKFFQNETQLILLLKKLMLEHNDDLSRRILKLLIRIYYKGIWQSKKLINLISLGIELKDQKSNQMVANFLISSAEQVYIGDDSDDDNENLKEMTKSLKKQYKYSKKKIDKMEQQIKNLKKKQKKREALQTQRNSYPIDQLYNPQQFVEKLIKKLNFKNIKNSLRITCLCLLGRLIGRHSLIQPQFYKTTLRFLRPEVKLIPKLLAFVSESVTENTLIEDLELISKQIIENFIFDGCAEEKIIMAINTLRIMMIRNENSLDKDQINYVCSFKDQKSKSVSLASKSFINVIRDTKPDLLNKEYQVYVKKGQIDQTLQKLKTNRINGVELLQEDDENIEVECDRILTDEDFKRIRKLQTRNLIKKQEKEENDNLNQIRSLHMPEVSLCEMKQQYEQMMKGKNLEQMNDDDINELINQQDEDDSDEDDSEEEDFDDDEEQDEIEFEEEEEQDQDEIEIENESEMEIEEDSDSDEGMNYMDEDDELEKRGFVTENMIGQFYKKKQKIREKSEDLLKMQVDKKLKNRKKLKKGSKTNTEKQKSQPYMMVINKIKKEKKQIKLIKKNKKIEKKRMKGHCQRKF